MCGCVCVDSELKTVRPSALACTLYFEFIVTETPRGKCELICRTILTFVVLFYIYSTQIELESIQPLYFGQTRP